MGKAGRKKDYGKGQEFLGRRIAAPALPYEPQDPKRYWPKIGLIGCGGISEMHLRAYRQAGYDVAAICDRHPERSDARRREFFPKAALYADYRDLLARDDIEVVDITTHPHDREAQIADALRAGKHVLSQKPFVLDLARGRKLVDLAQSRGLKLAVNQNGRWAPHFSYIRQAIANGLIGDVLSAHLAVHWNHDWVAGTKFDAIRHLILYDFGIHWFDIVTAFMGGRRAKRVYATSAHAAGQKAKPSLLGQAVIEFDDAQASIVFDGFAQFGALDTTYVAGTRGSIAGAGPNLDRQTLTLYTPRGYSRPRLRGTWFPGAFHGAMGELLCAIEQDRDPAHDARQNLESLALCFAACHSADTSRPQQPGSVKRLPD
jgi:predicted dehydrogenase